MMLPYMRPRIVIPMDMTETPDRPGSRRAQLRDRYIRLIYDNGGWPVLAPPHQPFADDWADGFAADGLLLCGGDDMHPSRFAGGAWHPKAVPLHPDREIGDFDWLAYADRRGLAVLGICLGMQEINAARGGSIHQYIPDMPGLLYHGLDGDNGYHDLAVTGPVLRTLIGEGPVRVNSRHKQAVDRLGRDLSAGARTSDGVIEAIEDVRAGDGRFVVGVQWHPEDLPDDSATKQLVSGFFEACIRRTS